MCDIIVNLQSFFIFLHVWYYLKTNCYMYQTLYFVNSVNLYFPSLYFTSILALLLLLTLFLLWGSPMSVSPMVIFGLPCQFPLLLWNCLVLSLFVFCSVKEMKKQNHERNRASISDEHTTNYWFHGCLFGLHCSLINWHEKDRKFADWIDAPNAAVFKCVRGPY